MKFRKSHRSQEDVEARFEHDGIVRLENVERWYGRGKNKTYALRTVNQAFPAGTFTAVMGPSGAGKSTFIQCSAGLDTPSKGKVFLGNTELSTLKEPLLTVTRRREIGFVFQAFNLLPALTARENILLPMALDGSRPDREWFGEITRKMGIDDLLGSLPTEMSGGQQQRVAIARAIISRPSVVFADEPTGALDSRSARATMELLRQTVDDYNQTMVMVTHDPVAASYADTVLFMADGQIVDQTRRSSADSIARRLAALEVPV